MTLLAIHAAATLSMTGLIWLVQLVHYPLFKYVAEERFPAFAAAHQRRISLLVVPLMLVEAATAAALLALAGPEVDRAPLWLGLALLGVIWLSTGLLQVPLHRRLEHGWDPAAARRLVATNWIRTLAWTGRSALVVTLLASGR